jgi:hypothetical protein
MISSRGRVASLLNIGGHEPASSIADGPMIMRPEKIILTHQLRV